MLSQMYSPKALFLTYRSLGKMARLTDLECFMQRYTTVMYS